MILQSKEYRHQLLKEMNELPPNVKNTNARDFQALIELKNEYCIKKRCLECSVGNNLLRNA